MGLDLLSILKAENEELRRVFRGITASLSSLTEEAERILL